MEFEWDAQKAASNVAKHGVTFPEEMTLFGDPLELVIADPHRSDDEFRFLSMGQSAMGPLLVVAYTEREGRARIISAVKRLPENGSSMNHHVRQNDNDEMRPEYDFSHGVRGKHYEAYRAGTNVVFLDSDVAKALADSASVNQALRLLLQLARTSVPSDMQLDKPVRPARRAKKPKPVRAARG
jgi:uncharacterized protein